MAFSTVSLGNIEYAPFTHDSVKKQMFRIILDILSLLFPHGDQSKAIDASRPSVTDEYFGRFGPETTKSKQKPKQDQSGANADKKTD
jgi:hypothetical protein